MDVVGQSALRWGRLSAGSQRIERRDASTHAKPQSQLCICRTWGTSSTPAPEVDAWEAPAARRLSATLADGPAGREGIVVDVHRVGVVGGDRRGGLGDGTGGGSRGDGRALHGEWRVGGVTRGGGRATTLHHGTESTRRVGGESIDPRRKYLGAHSRVRVPPPPRTRAGRSDALGTLAGGRVAPPRVVDRRRPRAVNVPPLRPDPRGELWFAERGQVTSNRRSRDLAHPRGTGPSRRFANRRVLIGFARKVSPIEKTRARSK